MSAARARGRGRGRGGARARNPSHRREKIILTQIGMAIEEGRGIVSVVNDEDGTVKKVENRKMALGTPVLIFPSGDDDLNKLYFYMFGIEGKDGAFVGGEYLGHLVLTDKYPSSPPNFVFMTPNGVYDPNKGTPCVSTGVYHQSDTRGVHGWAAGTGFMGFMLDIWGTFMDPESLGHGIHVLKFDVSSCKRLAENSREHNERTYPEIMAKLYETYPDIEERRAYHRAEAAEDFKKIDELSCQMGAMSVTSSAKSAAAASEK